MLVNLKEILAIAEEKKCAVGAFNTPNLECLIAVIDAAEKLGTPVIISHAELHENISPLEKIGPVMVQAAEKAGVPVCVQLDHGETLDYIERSLEIGFTGIMYDGSLLPYEENLMNTKKAVAMARSFNAGVEAELGAMPSREGGEAASGPVYTDPAQAEKFCRETGIDALAPSFGTTGLPLVMHGGSGVSEDDFRRAIKAGIRKINYYTYMSNAGSRAVRELLAKEDVTFFHDLAFAAQKAMQADAEKAMTVFMAPKR